MRKPAFIWLHVFAMAKALTIGLLIVAAGLLAIWVLEQSLRRFGMSIPGGLAPGLLAFSAVVGAFFARRYYDKSIAASAK